MSVVIPSDEDESVRDEVEAKYRREDRDVSYDKQAIPETNSYFDWESCC